jgi:hypothetical protein
MPAIAPIPPWAMKEILHLFGFQVIAEDEYNWVLSESRKERPHDGTSRYSPHTRNPE